MTSVCPGHGSVGIDTQAAEGSCRRSLGDGSLGFQGDEDRQYYVVGVSLEPSAQRLSGV